MCARSRVQVRVFEYMGMLDVHGHVLSLLEAKLRWSIRDDDLHLEVCHSARAHTHIHTHVRFAIHRTYMHTCRDSFVQESFVQDRNVRKKIA